MLLCLIRINRIHIVMKIVFLYYDEIQNKEQVRKRHAAYRIIDLNQTLVSVWIYETVYIIGKKLVSN